MPMASTSTMITVNPASAGEDANTVTQVVKEAIEPGPSPGFSGLLAHAKHVAEVVMSGARGHLAMKLHVGLKFGFETAAIEKIDDATPELAHWVFSYAVRRMS